MDTITITYRGHVAALAAPTRYWLAADIQALPNGHPTKRLIAYMILYARDILTGDLPGPYSDQRARTFARLALVDPAAYQTHQRKPDDQLARVLELPAIEIAHVRHDQAHVTT